MTLGHTYARPGMRTQAGTPWWSRSLLCDYPKWALFLDKAALPTCSHKGALFAVQNFTFSCFSRK